jgi:hypothetical protein
MKDTITPKLMTIREIARTGLMTEHALRLLLKQGKLPAIYIGAKALVNYDTLCAKLEGLGCEDFEGRREKSENYR